MTDDDSLRLLERAGRPAAYRAPSRPRELPHASTLWLVLAGIAALAVGGMLSVSPLMSTVFVFAGPAVALLLTSSRARLLAIVGGGLLVFQSSQGLDVGKLAYLAISVVCVAVSATRVARSESAALRCFAPLVPASALLLTYLAANALVAHGNGVPLADWSRDVLPYLLLAVLPVVGLDAAADIAPESLDRVIATLGVLSAIGFALDWLNRRHVSSLGLGRVILATTTMAALGFSYALTRSGVGTHKLRWLGVAAVIMIFMLVNGTRTNLGLLAALVGVTGSADKCRVNIVRLGRVLVPLLAIVAIGVPWLAARVTSDPAFLTKRLGDLTSVLAGHTGSDQSYLARQSAYHMAQAQFHAHPAFGTGAGYVYETATGLTASLDTSVSVPAKLGVAGLLVLAVYGTAILVAVVRSRRITGPLPIFTIGRAWLCVLVALTVLVPFVEDKGFSLSLAVFIASVASWTRRSESGAKGAVDTTESGGSSKRSRQSTGSHAHPRVDTMV